MEKVLTAPFKVSYLLNGVVTIVESTDIFLKIGSSVTPLGRPRI